MTDIKDTIGRLKKLMEQNSRLQDYLQKRQNELLALSDGKTAISNANWKLVDSLDSNLQKAIDDGAEIQRNLDEILGEHSDLA